MLHAIPVLELRSMPEGVVEGYASTFGGIDMYGDTIAPGAYAKSLVEHSAAGTTPALLWSHRQESPCGRWETLAEDARGLRVAGRLNLRSAAGREAYEHLQAGDITGLSVGYSVASGGFEQKGDVRRLTSLRLHEVSLVAIPADPAARITGVKWAGGRPGSLREFQAALQELGFSRRESARIAEKGFGGFTPDPSENNESDRLAVKAALRALTQSLKG